MLTIQHYGSLESLQNTSNYIGNTFLFNPLKTIFVVLLMLMCLIFIPIYLEMCWFRSNILDMLDDTSLAIGNILQMVLFESMMTFNKNNGISNSISSPFRDSLGLMYNCKHYWGCLLSRLVILISQLI